MQKKLIHLLKIYPSEFLSTVCFSLFIFCWSLGAASFRDVVDGFLLAHAKTAGIATSFWISAIALLVFSTTTLRAMQYYSSIDIIKCVSALSISLIVLFGLITQYTTPPSYFFIIAKASARAILVIFMAISWTLIDEYHDLQSAKRVYIIFNTTYFLGITINGMVIRSLLNSYGYLSILAISISAIIGGYLIAKKNCLLQKNGGRRYF